jgi:hypothetical protein
MAYVIADQLVLEPRVEEKRGLAGTLSTISQISNNEFFWCAKTCTVSKPRTGLSREGDLIWQAESLQLSVS